MKKNLLAAVLLLSSVVLGASSAAAVEIASEQGSLSRSEYENSLINAYTYKYSQEKGEIVDLDEPIYRGWIYDIFELDPASPALLIRDMPLSYYFYNDMMDVDFGATSSYLGGQSTLQEIGTGDGSEKITMDSTYRVLEAEAVENTDLTFTLESGDAHEMYITASQEMDGIVLFRGEYDDSIPVALHNGRGILPAYVTENVEAVAVIYSEKIDCEPKVEAQEPYETGSTSGANGEEDFIRWSTDLTIEFPEELNGLVLSYDETADRVMVSGVKGKDFIARAHRYLPVGETPEESEAEARYRVFGYIPFDGMDTVNFSAQLDQTWEEAFQQMPDDNKWVMTREGQISYEEYLEQKK